MEFSQEQVWQAVKAEAPKHGLDPWLVMALFEQESEHPNGDPTRYDARIPRLEENYMLRYVKPLGLSTVTTVLLSTSFGLPQMMGDSLRQAKDENGQNFFEWFRDITNAMYAYDENALSSLNVAAALDYFCVQLPLMVKWSCIWLAGKIKQAGSVNGGLDDWNGDHTGAYRNQVLARIGKLKLALKA